MFPLYVSQVQRFATYVSKPVASNVSSVKWSDRERKSSGNGGPRDIPHSTTLDALPTW